MSKNMLYRAKLKNPDKWMYGYYAAKQSTTYCIKEDYENFPVETEHYIIQERMTDWGLPNEFRLYEVNGNTICRNTGCVDQDNTPIFENDIVVIFFEYYDTSGNLQYESSMIRYIEYDKGAFVVKGGVYDVALYNYIQDNRQLTVIGNIYDNPELLEKLNEQTTDKETTKDS